MTRSLVRRAAAVGGALGIAVLACGGTASAATVNVATPAAGVAIAGHAHSAPAFANCLMPPTTPTNFPCPPFEHHHPHGLLGVLLFDVAHLLHIIL